MKLDKQLDDIHSQYIRLLFADENGKVKCYTCTSTFHYKVIQCGHYIDRANTQFRWDEDFTRPQCEDCNCFKSGSLKKFRSNLIAEHGFSKVENAEIQSLKPYKWSKWDKEQLLKKRKKQVKKLLEEKNITYEP